MREREGIIEFFMLRSSYKRLKERLELKEIYDMKCLHCERKINEYFDNIFINDNNLPDVVVEEYNNKVQCHIMSK